jgi:hypothetical protein
MKNLVIIGFAVVALSTASMETASAKVHNLGVLPLGDTNPTGAIIHNPTNGSKHPKSFAFSDTWNFTVSESERLDATVFNYNARTVIVHGVPKPVLLPHQQINSLHLSLYEDTTLIASSPIGNGGIAESLSIPDVIVVPSEIEHSHKVIEHYHFVVTGTVPKGDTGVYDLNVFTTAVPELSTWAMMIIGFGGVALQMHRRRRSIALSA